jgi:hypothetical protein
MKPFPFFLEICTSRLPSLSHLHLYHDHLLPYSYHPILLIIFVSSTPSTQLTFVSNLVTATLTANTMESQSDNSRERDSANSWSEFRVRFSSEELAQLASELREETIADVHLSLLTYWICESKDNYEEAKVHIRELNIDQVSCSVTEGQPQHIAFDAKGRTCASRSRGALRLIDPSDPEPDLILE